jgi:REP element-mobilizing transposase RayT
MPQSLTKLYVHIIFSTKNRFPFFKEETIRQETYRYIGKIIIENDSFPLIINGAQDHIHILCNLSKNKSLSDLIADIKRSSSKWLKTKGDIYKKFYWQRGYAAFSVSESTKESVTNYIKNQKAHHKHKSFKEEVIEFLEKYKAEYDLQYLWD